jgi:hypothetical protein
MTASDMLLYISTGSSSSSSGSSSGDCVRPQQPLHSLVALHSWQLDGLLQAQQGSGAAGSKWQGGRPEAVVACAGELCAAAAGVDALLTLLAGYGVWHVWLT